MMKLFLALLLISNCTGGPVAGAPGQINVPPVPVPVSVDSHSNTDAIQGQVNSGVMSTGARFGSYFLSDQPFSWYNAKTYCESAGMRLLSIETPKKDSNILGLMESNGMQVSWTSGIDANTYGHYFWASTGVYFNYASWINIDKPTDPNQNCVYTGTNSFWAQLGYQRAGWFIETCYASKRFICE